MRLAALLLLAGCAAPRPSRPVGERFALSDAQVAACRTEAQTAADAEDQFALDARRKAAAADLARGELERCLRARAPRPEVILSSERVVAYSALLCLADARYGDFLRVVPVPEAQQPTFYRYERIRWAGRRRLSEARAKELVCSDERVVGLKRCLEAWIEAGGPACVQADPAWVSDTT